MRKMALVVVLACVGSVYADDVVQVSAAPDGNGEAGEFAALADNPDLIPGAPQTQVVTPVLVSGGGPLPVVSPVQATLLVDADGNVLGMVQADLMRFGSGARTERQQRRDQIKARRTGMTTIERVQDHFSENWKRWAGGGAAAVLVYFLQDELRSRGGGSSTTINQTFANDGDVFNAMGQGNSQSGLSDDYSQGSGGMNNND